MDKETVQKLKDVISKSSNIGIAVGKNPSVDEMAAGLSLYLLLKEANKAVSIASPSEPIVEVSSLVGITKVQKSLGGDAGDLVVSFPYQEGEIEKVSYTLEEGFLNIIVKASEQGLSFDEQDIKFIRGSGAVDTLFVVGTPRLADLEDIIDSQKLTNMRVVNIDNKQHNEKFGDIVLVSPRFSSVSEQIADFALTLGFRIDQDTAQNLLIGVTSATDNFQKANTSALAFEVASFLMKRGAKRVMPTTQRDEFIESLSNDEEMSQPAPRFNQPREDRSQIDDQRRTQQQQQVARPQVQHNEAKSQEERKMNDNQDFMNQNEEENDEDAPVDWLTPKVYKGSSDV